MFYTVTVLLKTISFDDDRAILNGAVKIRILPTIKQC